MPNTDIDTEDNLSTKRNKKKISETNQFYLNVLEFTSQNEKKGN